MRELSPAPAHFNFRFTNAESDFSALFQVVGTLGSLSADLEFSMDGGTTFNKLVTGALVAATPFKLQTPIISGEIIWQLNITAAPTSADSTSR
jgi:hypothetical protein